MTITKKFSTIESYDEIVEAGSLIMKDQDSRAYALGESYDIVGHEMMVKAINTFKHNSLKEKYNVGTMSVNEYDVFNGYEAIELKNLFHELVFHFEWKAVDAIDGFCLFGRAYANAVKECGNNYYCQIPDAKMVFEQLSKLLKRMERDGFVIKDELRRYMK